MATGRSGTNDKSRVHDESFTVTPPRIRKQYASQETDKRAQSEIVILSCLQDEEKSLNELSKIFHVRYETLRNNVLRLVREGTLGRRMFQIAGKRKYLYKVKTVP
jgi:predicted transcriptional regulator